MCVSVAFLSRPRPKIQSVSVEAVQAVQMVKFFFFVAVKRCFSSLAMASAAITFTAHPHLPPLHTHTLHTHTKMAMTICSMRIVCAARAPTVRAAEEKDLPRTRAGSNFKNLGAAVDAGVVQVSLPFFVFFRSCCDTRACPSRILDTHPAIRSTRNTRVKARHEHRFVSRPGMSKRNPHCWFSFSYVAPLDPSKLLFLLFLQKKKKNEKYKKYKKNRRHKKNLSKKNTGKIKLIFPHLISTPSSSSSKYNQ